MMMMALATCVPFALTLWSLVYSAVLTEALKRLQKAERAPQRAPRPGQRWLLVRPLCGGTHNLQQLASVPKSSEQLQVVYLAAGDDEAGMQAAAQATRLCLERGLWAESITTEPGGPNGKAAQLAQIPQELLQNVWVLSLDDDVDAKTVHLDALQAALQSDPTMAAVWLPFVAQQQAHTWADVLAAQVLNTSPHALRVLAALGPANLTGKALAYRPALVETVGGWWPRARFFGDDLDLGQALAAQGLCVSALPSHPATAVRLDQTWRQVWQRHRRWGRIIVDQAPRLVPSYFWLMGGAPLLLLTWTCVLVWLGPEMPGAPWLPLGALGLVLFTRLRLLAQLGQVPQRSLFARLTLNLMADAFVLAACVAALVSPKVTWRGKVGRASR